MSLANTLAELIDTPSVTGDEEAIATAIERRLSALVAVERIGNSVVAGSRESRQLVVLYGHTDTVPEQGNGRHRVEGNRMFGLGASDMKAGLAVMLRLLEEDHAVDLAGVFYDREEGPAAENGLEAVLDGVPWLGDAALSIVLEPTDLRLELGCNGVLNAEVLFSGHAAHSARPWLGENAVTKAGSWLETLHRREPEAFTVADLEFLEVFSVTRATGGIANNVVPGTFTINLNYRFPPVFDLDEAEARLRSVAAAADDVVIKDRAPAAGIPAGNASLDRLKMLVSGAVGPKQGWTDVARLSARGIPAVNYGPGEVAQAHQAGESVALANLDVAHGVLAAFLGDH